MINYITNSIPDFQEVVSLYESVEWLNYTNQPEMLKVALENSLTLITAYDEEKLVGLIRVVGDGHSIIFIQDILVHPDYQRLGIGSTLLQMILDQYRDVYQMHLLTDSTVKTKQFYESMGFIDVSEWDCRCYTYVGR